MRKTLAIILLVSYLINQVYAQDSILTTHRFRSGIIIKSTPIPFVFETGIGGTLLVSQQQLCFMPDSCSNKDKFFQSVFPCNNYLFKPITINFETVTKIKRRNYLFLFPNRLFVMNKRGNSYLFFTYRRRRIIDAFNHYKVQRLLSNKG